MTNKEAIMHIKELSPKKCKMVGDRLQGGFPDHDSDTGKAIDAAIDALEKADKYRWHDLKENPDDLPKANRWGESNYVLVKALIKVGCYACNDMRKAYYNHTQKKWSIDGNVLAWRYIEPFKDEECVFWYE